MKILTFLNVSNRKNIQADSAYVFFDILSEYFTKDNEFIFISPVSLSDKKSLHIPMEFGFNKYEVRFSFYWSEVSNILKQFKPEILLINQIEHIAHYRAVLESLGQKPILAAYAHYIPYLIGPDGRIEPDTSLNNAGLGRAVRLNFFSGLCTADIVFTHSKTARRLLRVLYEENNEQFDENKFIINPPPLDPFLLDINRNPSIKAFYNHRLYKHYGTDFFYKLIEELSYKFNIKLNILDVLGERSEEQRRMDPSVEEARTKLSCIKNVSIFSDTYDRYKYRETIKGSLFSIAPYRENCIWAMSCVDSMAMGVPVIAPSIAWFKEFMPADLCFSTIDEALNIIGKLINDRGFWVSKSIEGREKVAYLAPAERAEVFLSTFRKRMET